MSKAESYKGMVTHMMSKQTHEGKSSMAFSKNTSSLEKVETHKGLKYPLSQQEDCVVPGTLSGTAGNGTLISPINEAKATEKKKAQEEKILYYYQKEVP